MSESTKNDAIYLQVCDDEDSEWLGYVTWCQDRIHESDVKYIRADLVESMRQQLANSQKQVTLLRDALEEVKLRSSSLADAQLTALEALAATEPKP